MPPCLQQPYGRARISRSLEVVGHRSRRGFTHGCERLRHLPMQSPPPNRRDALIQRLPDQHMRESHPRLAPRLRQETCRERPLRDTLDRPLVHLRHRRPCVQGHSLPDHGGDLQQPLRLLAEPHHAPVDHLPQQRRDRDRLQCIEARAACVYRPLLLESAKQLGREERVPLCAPREVRDEACLIPRGETVTGADEVA